MPRSRVIKSQFFVNQVLGELPPLARLLFIGLWTIADRDGRLKNRVKTIKVQVLPFDSCHINVLLTSLEDAKLITRYMAIDNTPCIQINNWFENQKIHPREKSNNLEPLEKAGKLNGSAAPFRGPATPKRCALEVEVEVEVEKETEVEVEVEVEKEGLVPSPLSPVTPSDANADSSSQRQPTEKPETAVESFKQIFNSYVLSWGKNGAYRLTPRRRGWIKRALDLYGFAECITAVKSFRNDSFVDRPRFNDIKYLFGTQERIDRWCGAQQSTAFERAKQEHIRDQEEIDLANQIVSERANRDEPK